MSRRARLIAGLVGLAALAVPTTAMAVFPGVNDKILFVSGIGPGSDADADLFINDIGDTTFLETEAISPNLTGQRRHPSISPDGTKIAFAVKPGADGDIFIHDRSDGSTVQMWGSDNIDDDRPNWSPNNRFVAFESEASAGQEYDIRVFDTNKPASGTNPVNLTVSDNVHEGKPVFSPDGAFIYHAQGTASINEDIARRPSGQIGGASTDIVASATAEYQPALDPTGTQLCYTRGPFGSADAEIFVRSSAAGSPATAGTDLSDTALGGYNCAWSNDGAQIAWVEKPFGQGRLMSEPSTDGTATLLVSDTTDRFDGNPEYIREPQECQDQPASIIGTANPDTLNGFEFKDVFQGLAGDDTMKGKGKNDRMCGRGGEDNLKGGSENDVLFGEGNNDTLNGNAGKDKCFGGGGNDTFKNCEDIEQ